MAALIIIDNEFILVGGVATRRNIQFTIDSERQVFWKLFMAYLLVFILRVFARNLLKGSRRRNIFISLRFDVWTELAINPAHCQLDYGDFSATALPLNQIWCEELCHLDKSAQLFYWDDFVITNYDAEWYSFELITNSFSIRNYSA